MLNTIRDRNSHMESSTENVKDTVDTQITTISTQLEKGRIVEAIFYLFISLLILLEPILEIIHSNISIEKFFSIYYDQFTLSSGILIMPYIYLLISGYLPFESIRNKLGLGKKRTTKTRHVKAIPQFSNYLDQLVSKRTHQKEPLEYFSELATSSGKTANNLYSRSTSYLVTGVIVAFSGLYFFYSQMSNITLDTGTSNSFSAVVSILPNLGILFFIEFVALFFLKQYRATMDEFRYYESIQRSREETLAILKLASQSEPGIDLFTIIEKCGIRSSPEKLADGQTTDIIESKKMSKDEADLFRRIVEIIGNNK